MNNVIRYALVAVVVAAITLGVSRYVNRPASVAVKDDIPVLRQVEELNKKVAELTRANQELAKAAEKNAGPGLIPQASSTSTPAATAGAVEPAVVPPEHPAPAEPAKVLTPTGESLPPRGQGLGVDRAEPVAVEGALGASLRFRPTDDKPLGIVAIVAELPIDASSQILSFGPADTNGFSQAVSAIRRQGHFAIFHAQADRLKDLDLRISVTAPVKVNIRGTAGIGPLSLEVGPGRVSVGR